MKENFTRYGEAAVKKFEDKNLSTTISIKATDIQLLDMMLLLFCFKLCNYGSSYDHMVKGKCILIAMCQSCKMT